MNIEDMKKAMDALAKKFDNHKRNFNDQEVNNLQKNKRFATLCARLYHLMQFPEFFQVLFNDGFKKSSTVLKNHWRYASPIAPLLYTFFGFLTANWKPEGKFSFPDVYVEERQWIAPELDQWFSIKLFDRCKNEEWFGLTENSQYEDLDRIITRMLSSPMEKATAIVGITNGTHSEPLFIIKEKNTIEIITSNSGYVDSRIRAIVRKHNLKLIHHDNVVVIHNGNCAVHTGRNINIVLAQSFLNNSVYNTIDALRKGTFLISDYQLEIRDLSSDYKSADIPDPQTLDRLFFALTRILHQHCIKSAWYPFCNDKYIDARRPMKIPCIFDERAVQSREISWPLFNTICSKIKNENIDLVPQKKVILNKHLKAYMEHIKVIKEKRNAFDMDAQYDDAYNAADTLYKNLKKLGHAYFTSDAPTEESYKTFTEACDAEILEARKVLDNHRGWKKILLHIAAFIVTLGIGYLAVAACDLIKNKGRFTLFETNSTKMLYEVQEEIAGITTDKPKL